MENNKKWEFRRGWVWHFMGYSLFFASLWLSFYSVFEHHFLFVYCFFSVLRSFRLVPFSLCLSVIIFNLTVSIVPFGLWRIWGCLLTVSIRQFVSSLVGVSCWFWCFRSCFWGISCPFFVIVLLLFLILFVFLEKMYIVKRKRKIRLVPFSLFVFLWSFLF